MSDENEKKYFKLYKYYKKRCDELSKQVQQMQSLIDSCRMLLERGIQDDQPTMSRTSTSPERKRRLTFSTESSFASDESSSLQDKSNESVCSLPEPGGNKWECYDIEDWSKYNLMNMVQFAEELADKAEEGKENKQGGNKPLDTFTPSNKGKPFNTNVSTVDSSPKVTEVLKDCGSKVCTKKADNSTEGGVSSYKSDAKLYGQTVACGDSLPWISCAVKNAKRDKKQVKKEVQKQETPLEFSPGHICKLPRCEKHQPFFLSSARKIAKLSPNKRHLATNRRGKSPPGKVLS